MVGKFRRKEEAMNKVACPYCDGRGYDINTPCHSCIGGGCQYCDGTGIDLDTPCPVCYGSGEINIKYQGGKNEKKKRKG
jgi:DnaJ-class molecular chaperone